MRRVFVGMALAVVALGCRPSPEAIPPDRDTAVESSDTDAPVETADTDSGPTCQPPLGVAEISCAAAEFYDPRGFVPTGTAVAYDGGGRAIGIGCSMCGEGGTVYLLSAPRGGLVDLESGDYEGRILGTYKDEYLGTELGAAPLLGRGVDDWLVGVTGGVAVFMDVRGELTSSDAVYLFLPASDRPAKLTGADLDGDGLLDLIAGFDNELAENGYERGAIFIDAGPISGAVSAEPSTAIWGVGDRPIFGRDISTEDGDGDGDHDLIVGAPLASGTRGAAYVFLDVPRGELQASDADVTITGLKVGDYLANSISIADATDDGYADVFVGADGVNELYGAAYLIEGPVTSGRGPAEALVTIRSTHSAALGWSTSVEADLDGSGHPDLVVGAPYHSQYTDTSYTFGVVAFFYDPAPGTYTEADADGLLHADEDAHTLSSTLAGDLIDLGDYNEDGFDDLLVPGWLGSVYLILGGAL